MQEIPVGVTSARQELAGVEGPSGSADVLSRDVSAQGSILIKGWKVCPPATGEAVATSLSRPGHALEMHWKLVHREML